MPFAVRVPYETDAGGRADSKEERGRFRCRQCDQLTDRPTRFGNRWLAVPDRLNRRVC